MGAGGGAEGEEGRISGRRPAEHRAQCGALSQDPEIMELKSRDAQLTESPRYPSVVSFDLNRFLSLSFSFMTLTFFRDSLVSILSLNSSLSTISSWLDLCLFGQESITFNPINSTSGNLLGENNSKHVKDSLYGFQAAQLLNNNKITTHMLREDTGYPAVRSVLYVLYLT